MSQQPQAQAPPQAQLCALLTWADPVKTGKVFGSIIATLLVLKSVNILSLVFRLISLSLFTSAVAEYAGKKVTGTGFVTRFRPAYSTCFSQHGAKVLKTVQEKLPCFEEQVQKLFYSFNVENTLKFAGITYVLYKITSILSVFTILVSATVLAFTFPKFYRTYEKEIDEAVAKLKAVLKQKSSEYSKIAQEKAAPVLKQVDEKLGPVSKFVKEQYKVRTAGSTVAAENKVSSSSVESVAESIPVPQHPAATAESSATTTSATKNPFSEASFPSAPQTNIINEIKTEAQAATNDPVDVSELKADFLKNKASAI